MALYILVFIFLDSKREYKSLKDLYVAGIPRISTAFNFFVLALFICDCCFQIFEGGHILKWIFVSFFVIFPLCL